MRLLRGRVLVRELVEEGIVWTPDESPRQRRTHRGIVLAMGPPALAFECHEVPYFFGVGDVVQYHFEHHQEAWTMPWIDGEPATWLAQHNVDAVVEP